MISKSNTIKIKLNKLKITLIAFGSLLFVIFGIGISYKAGFKISSVNLFPIIIGTISIIFFGMALISMISKLFDQRPGLIISDKGIFDNSSAVGGQLIKWRDVSGFDITNINNNVFILIFVQNPEEYLSNANLFKKFWMKLNGKFYGTPLFVATKFLKCDSAELYITIQKESEKYCAQQRV
ncbi:STM3941 family protein [Psychroserpens sp. XS_ASV72]|uniref:STM3941 family protein n=1 Tax=Psychroserpens sp. XS_ASV72 TaxID=3241293 RepID=UPI003513F2A0